MTADADAWQILVIDNRQASTLSQRSQRGLCCLALLAGLVAAPACAAQPQQVFRAGAAAVDVTPVKLPVHVLGMFTDRVSDKINDRLYARCLVLDDGMERIAIAVVDNCMMPRDLLDHAKDLARQRTGIRTDRMLISATHTHSAPAAMGGLGTPLDDEYVKFLPGRLAEGLELALKNLAPACVGWAVIQDDEHTHCRRWILRPDKMGKDPFGEVTVRANMHPGYQNPGAIGPAGPVDPALSILSLQSTNGQPIALLANYSMHYYDSPPLSADYFGRFAEKTAKLIGAGGLPPFVAIMSQGTSGDQMWMDYGQSRKNPGLDTYSEEMAQIAFKAWQKIRYHDWVPLAMAEAKLTLNFRLCDDKRLAWAKKLVAEMKGRLPRTLPEVYAYEQEYLHQRPQAELKLQAIRIGDLGIAVIPNEVFAITGLKVKAQSPLQPTFIIELANGSEGYIPPPEQHKLGGYTTWAARTAGLEVTAEPRIVETVLRLLEDVSDKPRRQLVESHGPYAKAVLASKPLAFWRGTEFNGPQAHDATGRRNHATYEGGVAFYLEGPPSAQFSGEGVINRCPHFAGGWLQASLADLGQRYSIELWFWNGLPSDARGVTGWLIARGGDHTGERLGITGTNSAPGRLWLKAGEPTITAIGVSQIQAKRWNHLVLVRDGKRFAAYLNGNVQPELMAEADGSSVSGAGEICIGGTGHANAPSFEGKIDEVAIYKCPLDPKEIAAHYQESGMAR